MSIHFDVLQDPVEVAPDPGVDPGHALLAAAVGRAEADDADQPPEVEAPAAVGRGHGHGLAH